MQDTLAPAPVKPHSVGELLRAWRAKRRLSQLEVALVADVSARHLSFIETGRAKPSPELLLAVAEVLTVPLRERNTLLLAAGYAPRYSQSELDAPDIRHVMQALRRVLDAHDPYPGIAMDRHWNLVFANAAALRLTAALPAHVKQPVPNIFRIGLHPQGLAASTANFDEWGRTLLDELERLAAASLDGAAQALLDEVRGYPNVQALLRRARPAPPLQAPLLVPCVLDMAGQRLSFFTTLATIGTPRDVTLAELTLELFYPADAATEAALRAVKSTP